MDISSPGLTALIVAVFGLTVGSFLNVVIHRLPRMIRSEWLQQCKTFLWQGVRFDEDESYDHINLVYPDSRCPYCHHEIRFYENIPVISYLFLRGRCTSCKTPISIQYPLVELSTALLSAIVGWHYGFSWQTLAALILTWGLVAHTVIDIHHQILPDNITYPLLWLGLLCNTSGLFTDPVSAIFGAAAGYLILWTVFQIFRLATGKEGMGYGDFKLLALIGAWGGWQILPMTILLSSIMGAVIGALILLWQKRGSQTPLPFGPYLAIAGWIALLWGHDITQTYLALF
ncbi:MAG: prepilin peptidase [Gammaproteobacteria bacterium]|nr:MAG: prepilin peptidase [Gammaproteobacteria bacterium]